MLTREAQLGGLKRAPAASRKASTSPQFLIARWYCAYLPEWSGERGLTERSLRTIIRAPRATADARFSHLEK
jgi:hypothetical protein